MHWKNKPTKPKCIVFTLLYRCGYCVYTWFEIPQKGMKIQPLGQDFIGDENICTVLKTYIYLST